MGTNAVCAKGLAGEAYIQLIKINNINYPVGKNDIAVVNAAAGDVIAFVYTDGLVVAEFLLEIGYRPQFAGQ